MKKVLNILSWTLVGLVIALAVLLVGIRVLGYQIFTVLSGSMEPKYKTGSVIYVEEVDYRTLQVGDPITYMISKTTTVTHEIVAIEQDPADPMVLWFRTKGLANDSEDMNPVHYRNVIGKVVFSIPYLGYVADFVQKPPGLYVALGATAVLLVILFWPSKKKEKVDWGDLSL